MSGELCEIAESYAVAASSCPATDVIVVEGSTAAAVATIFLGLAMPVLVSVADAADWVEADGYAGVASTADAQSEVVGSTVVDKLLLSKGKAASSLFVEFDQTVESTAAATGSIVYMDTPILLVSTAAATSSTSGSYGAGNGLATEMALATSSMFPGSSELGISSAVAASEVFATRVGSVLATGTAVAGSVAYPTTTPKLMLAISTADGTSTTFINYVGSVTADSTAHAQSDVWFKNPAMVAWVLNTESTGAGWYTNFDFESIASTPDQVLAVGPDGLYVLAGGTDSGEQIDSEIQSGFVDFGVPQTKRVDAMYFGYTSDGQISLKVETKESGHSPATYLLEERDAAAPRNSRVTPGKGMYGRYWRMTIKNVDGADFEIHDATVDLAVSNRKL